MADGFDGLEGNIKLDQHSPVDDEESKNNHGFQAEVSTNASEAGGDAGLHTLDEPVVETIVSERNEFCWLYRVVEKGFDENLVKVAHCD